MRINVKEIFVKSAIGACFAVFFGGLLLVVGAKQKVAEMIGDYPWVVTGILMMAIGLAGLIGAATWIALGLEDKIKDRFSPRPRLGSLVYRDTVLHGRARDNVLKDAELIVTLINQNDDLIEQHAIVRGYVNGRQLSEEAALNGYAPAKGGAASLIIQMGDVLFEPMDGGGRIEGSLDYDIGYWYPSRRRKRSTGRTIDFSHHFTLGEAVRTPMRITFRNQRET
jgi:hypothetical protein